MATDPRCGTCGPARAGRAEVRSGLQEVARCELLRAQHLGEVEHLAGRHTMLLERGDRLCGRPTASHGATSASISSARSNRTAGAYNDSSAISSTVSVVMQKLSHWSLLAAPTLIQPPSPHWYNPIGWNDSPKRRPHRRFSAPVWVYMVSDHWWAGRWPPSHRRRGADPRPCGRRASPRPGRRPPGWRRRGTTPRPAALQGLATGLTGHVEVAAGRPIDERGRPPPGIRSGQAEPAGDGVDGRGIGRDHPAVQVAGDVGVTVARGHDEVGPRNASSNAGSSGSSATDRLPASRYSCVALRKAPTRREPRSHRPGRCAAGRLDEHDVGTRHGEQPTAIRTGQRPAELEHTQVTHAPSTPVRSSPDATVPLA